MVVRIGNTMGEFGNRYAWRFDARKVKGKGGWKGHRLRWLAISGYEIDVDMGDITDVVDKVGEIIIGKDGNDYYIEILDGYRE